MAPRCTKRSLPNYFDMTSYRWNVRQSTVTWHWWMSGKNKMTSCTKCAWYKVLYQHTMYVISLSNISIKTNFKQITRVELKFVQYSQGDYILCMTSLYFFRSFTNARLRCFVSHSNDMTSCQSSSAENVSCNVTPFFYHHSVCGDTPSCIMHIVSDRLLSLISKENVHNVR